MQFMVLIYILIYHFIYNNNYNNTNNNLKLGDNEAYREIKILFTL